MAGRKSAAAEVRWRELLERQAGSGLSIRRFCASEGISEPSFYTWRRRLRQGQDKEARCRPSRNREDNRNNVESFVALKLLDAVGTLEIVHPLGYRIQVSGDVDPVALRRVIEALDERRSP